MLCAISNWCLISKIIAGYENVHKRASCPEDVRNDYDIPLANGNYLESNNNLYTNSCAGDVCVFSSLLLKKRSEQK